MGGILHTVGGILGTNDNSGENFQAKSTALENPVYKAQVANAIQQNQGGINQQNAFTNAINARNPLEQQAAAYNQQQQFNQGLAGVDPTKSAAAALAAQQGLGSQLSGVSQVGAQANNISNMNQLQQGLAENNGARNLGSVYGQQQALAGQLGDMAQGNGPNPALAQLNNTTGQNIQQQAALMASQRGAGANVGLLARNAANVGAQAQQQAVGQAAAMRAQQQLGAIGALQGQQQALAQTAGNQIGFQQGQQQSIQNATAQQIAQQAAINQQNAGQANALMGYQQMGINSANTLAAGQVAQQQQALEAMNRNLQGNQNSLLGAVTAQDTTNAGQLASMNSNNAHIAGIQAGQQGNLYGGAINGAAGALSGLVGGSSGASGGGGLMAAAPLMMAATGGMATKHGMIRKAYDEGGVVSSTSQDPSQPKSMFGRMLAGLAKPPMTQAPSQQPKTDEQEGDQKLNAVGNTLGSALVRGVAGLAMSKGGKVPAMVSPGEVYLPPSKVKEVEKGKDPIEAGEKIPGKAKVKGDSLTNDTVPKTLDEGGIVLPRSILDSDDPHGEAHKFIADVLAKHRAGKK